MKKYRVGILVIIIMIALQLLLPGILKLIEEKSKFASFLDNNFRLSDKVDRVVFDSFLNHISRQSGYKIIFIGDSVVEGAGVKSDEDTIPAFFQKLCETNFPNRDIKVYNMAIQGNRVSDIYFSLEKINEHNAADLVIMNINYAFFSDEMVKKVPIARPDIYADVMDAESAKILGIKYSSAEHFVVNNIIKHWNVYGMREDFSYLLFGMSPREKLRDTISKLMSGKKSEVETSANTIEQNKTDKPWWLNKTYPTDKIKHWMEVFNIGTVDETNRGYYFLKKITSGIKKDNIQAVAFFTPMNKKMIEKYNLMKYGVNLQSNMDTIRNEFSQNIIPVFDYTSKIDSDNFYDLFHLIAPGNQHLAEILMNDIKPQIQKGVSQ